MAEFNDADENRIIVARQRKPAPPRFRKGNPNLSKHATGLKTKEGFLKSIIWRNRLPTTNSKILKHFRQCDHCPLGERTIRVQIADRVVERHMPARCRVYEPGKTDCPIGVEQYVAWLREYYRKVNDDDYVRSTAKILFDETMSSLKIIKDTEIVEKGRPGYYTIQQTNAAAKVLDVLAKIEYGGDKHLHLYQNQDLSEVLVDKMFGTQADEVIENGAGTEKTEEKKEE